MALSNPFYNKTIEKYTIVFGNYFNNIKIRRRVNAEATEVQELIVPIAYGPRQKFLSRLRQDKNLDKKAAIVLPRMSFDMTSMSYDPVRKLSAFKVHNSQVSPSRVMSPVPYNFEFSLTIMTKYEEDGYRIIEQIMPFFTPTLTSSVQLIDNVDPIDIPLTLNDVTAEDVYDSAYTERRVLMWTLNFTMKGYIFGPTYDQPLIKFVEVDMFDGIESDTYFERVETQPGLTANGEPTTDITLTIPYADINPDDDYDIITTVRQNDE